MSNTRGRIPDVNWGRNMWDRIKSLFDGVKSDVSNLDDRVEALEEGGSGEENVIEAISFNGTNVPPDANKRVSMSESDPTVPNWAKQNSKPSYTAAEVGALPDTTTFVSGVKGDKESSYRSGNVNLTPANIGALPLGNYTMGAAASSGLNRMFNRVDITKPDNDVPGSEQMGQLMTAMDKNDRRFFVARATASGTGNVELHIGFYNHDGSDTIGTYGRAEIAKNGTITFTFSHPDEIRQALDIIEATTTQAGLMSAADKTKLDGIAPGGGDVNVIEAVSFNGVNVPPDGNKNVALVESDPTVPSWAKQNSKPSYTAAEVGALPDTTPIPSKTSDLTNDSGFLTSATGVSGVKGAAESSYRKGNVELTAANVGAVAKSGDTMTGDLITDSDIILTDGYLKGSANDGINHAIKLGHSGDNVMEFNEYGGQYDFYSNESNPRELIFQIRGSQGVSDAPLPVTSGGTGATNAAGARANLEVLRTGHPDPVNLDTILYNYIGTVWNATGTGVSVFGSTCGTLICTDTDPFGTSGTRLQQIFMNFFGNDIWIRKRNDTTWSNWTCLRQSNGAVPVAAGGTGATTAAVTITNNYSSVQNVINAVKNTRSFPISIQKAGTASYSDMPSGYATAEWNLMLIGDPTRLTALMFIYTTSLVFSRNFYNGTWFDGWSQIK